MKAHFLLVQEGLRIHESRDYEGALPYFEKALKIRPSCPNALYNKANVLHMLGRDEEALKILFELIKRNDASYRESCPDSVETPRSLRLDCYFLTFICTLQQTGSWQKAAPYLRKHLALRCKGLRSIWSRAQVIAEAEELRKKYSPRAKAVT